MENGVVMIINNISIKNTNKKRKSEKDRSVRTSSEWKM